MLRLVLRMILAVGMLSAPLIGATIATGTTLPYDQIALSYGGFEEDLLLLDMRHRLAVSIRRTDEMVNASDLAWSPDGRYLLYSSLGDLYTVDITTLRTRQQTDLGHRTHSAAWSPDGTRLAFATNVDLVTDLRVGDFDGETLAEPRLITEFSAVNGVGGVDWSPDGQFIVFSLTGAPMIGRMEVNSLHFNRVSMDRALLSISQIDHTRNSDHIAFSGTMAGDTFANIYEVLPNGTTTAHAVHVTRGGPFAWSPDGTRLVYATGRSGSNVFVMHVDSGDHVGATVLPPMWVWR